MPAQHCLVHWLNENLWDVWPLTKVPAEHRYENALAMLPWEDGQEYLGKVILISASMDKIEAEEAKLYKMVKEKEKTVKNTKRKSKELKKSGTASENDVRKAIGEKLKLNPAQENAKKIVAAEKRKKEANRNNVERSEEQKLIGNSARKCLDFLSSKDESASGAAQSRSGTAHDVMSGEEDNDSDTVVEMDKDMVPKPSVPCDIEEPPSASKNVVESSAAVDNQIEDGDQDNKFFKDFCNPNTEQFLRRLMTVMGFNKVEATVPSASTPTNSTDGFAKPQIVESQKMVPLKKGFKLLICKSGRNKLLVDTKSQKTTTVFTRKTLTELYGEDQLAQMTALGRKKNKLGIPSNDLNSIYGFVNDHCNDQIQWKDFIACVNKKCSSMKSPGSSKSKNAAVSTKSQDVEPASPKKNLLSESPLKSPAKKNRLGFSSPFKSPSKTTPSKSPRKCSQGSSTPRKFLKSPAKPFVVSDSPVPQPGTASEVPHVSQQQSWLWPSQRQKSSYQQPTWPQPSAAIHNNYQPSSSHQQPSSYESSSASAQYHSYQQQPSYHSQYYQQAYPQQTSSEYYPQHWQEGWEDHHPVPNMTQL